MYILNQGENLCGHELGKVLGFVCLLFGWGAQKAQIIFKKMLNWISSKFKTSGSLKLLLRKGKPQTEKKHLQNMYLTRSLYMEYVQNSYNLVRQPSS